MSVAVPSQIVLNGQAVSGTNSYLSQSSDVPYLCEVSYLVDVASSSGPVAGAIAIEVSNATEEQIKAGTDKWITFSGVTPPTVSGSMTFGLDFRCRYRRVRVRYTNSSGTGTITIIVTIKKA